jgi:hypothetical protein
MGTEDDIFKGCNPSSADLTPGSNGSPGLGYGCTAKVIQEGDINY